MDRSPGAFIPEESSTVPPQPSDVTAPSTRQVGRPCTPFARTAPSDGAGPSANTSRGGRPPPATGRDGPTYRAGWATVYAFPPDGSLRWSRAIGEHITGPPAVSVNGV